MKNLEYSKTKQKSHSRILLGDYLLLEENERKREKEHRSLKSLNGKSKTMEGDIDKLNSLTSDLKTGRTNIMRKIENLSVSLILASWIYKSCKVRISK